MYMYIYIFFNELKIDWDYESFNRKKIIRLCSKYTNFKKYFQKTQF